MKSFLQLVLLSVISIASATYFELDSSPTCGSKGLKFNITLDCSSTGTNKCNFGDTATITGNLVVPSGGMSDEVQLTNKACFMGIQSKSTCQTYAVNTSLCTLFNLGQYGCPDAGEYALDGSFTLPASSGNVQLDRLWFSKYDWYRYLYFLFWIVAHTAFVLVLSDTFVKVYTTIKPLDSGSNPTYKCTSKVNVFKGTANSSSYMIGFSAVMLAGLGAFFFKRRRTAKIDLSKEEAMLGSGDFEMMHDSVRV
jgi:hypothetical protein